MKPQNLTRVCLGASLPWQRVWDHHIFPVNIWGANLESLSSALEEKGLSKCRVLFCAFALCRTASQAPLSVRPVVVMTGKCVSVCVCCLLLNNGFDCFAAYCSLRHTSHAWPRSSTIKQRQRSCTWEALGHIKLQKRLTHTDAHSSYCQLMSEKTRQRFVGRTEQHAVWSK